MTAKKEIPYLNRDLKSLPGERWKPIFGMEDYFMISSFGRVKRLEYEMTYKNGSVYVKREIILKPEIRRYVNQYKNDYGEYLVASPVLGGFRYNFTLARLVYCTFNRGLDYYDFTRVIFYKDGDSFNIHFSNLYVATLSEKQKRIKELRRSPNPFHKLSPKQVKERHWQMLKFHLKKITQYSIGGRKLKTYSSIAIAHRATGCNATGISRTAKGYHRSCGGYGWKYAK